MWITLTENVYTDWYLNAMIVYVFFKRRLASGWITELSVVCRIDIAVYENGLLFIM